MVFRRFVLLPEDHITTRATQVDTIQDPTLLLVEAPRQESERYRTLARRAGFRILTANSEAMASVLCRRCQPNLVVLSRLPGASELARTLKEDAKTSDIPIMILVESASPNPDISLVYPTEACTSAAASDEEIVKTMRTLRSHRRSDYKEPKPSGPLEGDFVDDTFPGVLEFLFMTRKTGRIAVLNVSRRPGHIYIEDGYVVHAELTNESGLDAFNSMCFLKRGRFKFEPEFRAPEQTMTENGMGILLESARCHDEAVRTMNGTQG